MQNAGGYIEAGRVCGEFPVSLSVMRSQFSGNLSLSRAIGDFEFKKEYSLQPEDQMITSNPDITEHEIEEDDEFLIVACDGKKLLFTPCNTWITITGAKVSGIAYLLKRSWITSGGACNNEKHSLKFARKSWIIV